MDGTRFYINCVHLLVCVCVCVCVCERERERERESAREREMKHLSVSAAIALYGGLYHQTVAPNKKGTVNEIVLFLYRVSTKPRLIY